MSTKDRISDALLLLGEHFELPDDERRSASTIECHELLKYAGRLQVEKRERDQASNERLERERNEALDREKKLQAELNKARTDIASKDETIISLTKERDKRDAQDLASKKREREKVLEDLDELQQKKRKLDEELANTV